MPHLEENPREEEREGEVKTEKRADQKERGKGGGQRS